MHGTTPSLFFKFLIPYFFFLFLRGTKFEHDIIMNIRSQVWNPKNRLTQLKWDIIASLWSNVLAKWRNNFLQHWYTRRENLVFYEGA